MRNRGRTGVRQPTGSCAASRNSIESILTQDADTSLHLCLQDGGAGAGSVVWSLRFPEGTREAVGASPHNPRRNVPSADRRRQKTTSDSSPPWMQAAPSQCGERPHGHRAISRRIEFRQEATQRVADLSLMWTTSGLRTTRSEPVNERFDRWQLLRIGLRTTNPILNE
jgi:hypothetical protein